jgi:hypothetical protein
VQVLGEGLCLRHAWDLRMSFKGPGGVAVVLFFAQLRSPVIFSSRLPGHMPNLAPDSCLVSITSVTFFWIPSSDPSYRY